MAYAQLTAANVFTQINTFAGVTVTGATVPANGMYRSAANTLAFSSNTTLRWSVNANGAHVFAAPTVSSVVITASGNISSTAAVPTIAATAAAGNLAVISICGNNGVSGTSDFEFLHGTTGIATIVNRVAQPLNIGTNNTTMLALASNGSMVVSTPTGAATAFTINAIAGSIALQLSPGNSASIGLKILDPGANTTDLRLNTNNAGAVVQVNGTVGTLTLQSVTGAIISAPSVGGNRPLIVQGSGSTNATASQIYEPLFGIAAVTFAATYETGTFTGTITGCTTAPTATFNYTRVGNVGYIDCAAGLSATSNTVNLTITGMTSVLTPAATRIARCYVLDNGATKSARCTISGTTLTFDLDLVVAANLIPTAASFTNSGVKGVGTGINGLSISFQIN